MYDFLDHDILSKEETDRLVGQYQNDECLESMHRLVQCNMRLIHKFADDDENTKSPEVMREILCTDAELSGILLKSLQFFHNAKKRGRFSESIHSMESTAEYLQDNSVVCQFTTDCLDVESADDTPFNEIYEFYMKWMRYQGQYNAIMKKREFSLKMKTEAGLETSRSSGHAKTVYKNVCIDENSEHVSSVKTALTDDSNF